MSIDSVDRIRVAYEIQHGHPLPGQWPSAADDLATGEETVLVETHSVYGQVEWTDDSAVLFALLQSGSEATTHDV